MPEIAHDTTVYVDFEVFCGECGAGMCSRTTVDGADVHVSPCNNCLTESYDDGESAGYESAKGDFEQTIADLEATIRELQEGQTALEPSYVLPPVL